MPNNSEIRVPMMPPSSPPPPVIDDDDDNDDRNRRRDAEGNPPSSSSGSSSLPSSSPPSAPAMGAEFIETAKQTTMALLDLLKQKEKEMRSSNGAASAAATDIDNVYVKARELQQLLMKATSLPQTTDMALKEKRRFSSSCSSLPLEDEEFMPASKRAKVEEEEASAFSFASSHQRLVEEEDEWCPPKPLPKQEEEEMQKEMQKEEEEYSTKKEKVRFGWCPPKPLPKEEEEQKEMRKEEEEDSTKKEKVRFGWCPPKPLPREEEEEMQKEMQKKEDSTKKEKIRFGCYPLRRHLPNRREKQKEMQKEKDEDSTKKEKVRFGWCPPKLTKEEEEKQRQKEKEKEESTPLSPRTSNELLMATVMRGIRARKEKEKRLEELRKRPLLGDFRYDGPPPRTPSEDRMYFTAFFDWQLKTLNLTSIDRKKLQKLRDKVNTVGAPEVENYFNEHPVRESSLAEIREDARREVMRQEELRRRKEQWLEELKEQGRRLQQRLEEDEEFCAQYQSYASSVKAVIVGFQRECEQQMMEELKRQQPRPRASSRSVAVHREQPRSALSLARERLGAVLGGEMAVGPGTGHVFNSPEYKAALEEYMAEKRKQPDYKPALDDGCHMIDWGDPENWAKVVAYQKGESDALSSIPMVYRPRLDYEQWRRYRQQVSDSGGFDMDDDFSWSCVPNLIVPIPLDSHHYKSDVDRCTDAAIKHHNEDKDNLQKGRQLQLVEIKKCNVQFPLTFYITFTARPDAAAAAGTTNNNEEETETYQAKVAMKYHDRKKFETTDREPVVYVFRRKADITRPWQPEEYDYYRDERCSCLRASCECVFD